MMLHSISLKKYLLLPIQQQSIYELLIFLFSFLVLGGGICIPMRVGALGNLLTIVFQASDT